MASRAARRDRWCQDLPRRTRRRLRCPPGGSHGPQTSSPAIQGHVPLNRVGLTETRRRGEPENDRTSGGNDRLRTALHDVRSVTPGLGTSPRRARPPGTPFTRSSRDLAGRRGTSTLTRVRTGPRKPLPDKPRNETRSDGASVADSGGCGPSGKQDRVDKGDAGNGMSPRGVDGHDVPPRCPGGCPREQCAAVAYGEDRTLAARVASGPLIRLPHNPAVTRSAPERYRPHTRSSCERGRSSGARWAGGPVSLKRRTAGGGRMHSGDTRGGISVTGSAATNRATILLSPTPPSIPLSTGSCEPPPGVELAVARHQPRQCELHRPTLTAASGCIAQAAERALHLDEHISVARQFQEAMLTAAT